MSLRARLILLFLVATLVPLGITLWITASLVETSLAYSPTVELDEVSRSLEQTGREFYQRAREALKSEAQSGRSAPERYALSGRGKWPEAVEAFWASGARERFLVSGEEGDRLNYLVRADANGQPHGVLVYSRRLGAVGMTRLSRQYTRAREALERIRRGDLRRGFTWTLVVLAAAVWVVSLAVLIALTLRISRPIRQLTGGLSELAAGNFGVRLPERGAGEAGRALAAFNRTAAQLEESRERTLYLSRLAGWQSLARKTAHEIKNSLTPIRLTMEEILARRNEHDPAFLESASQIVADEVSSLERRVRAFSEFAAEPPVKARRVDLNELLEERVAFLRAAHPQVIYNLELAPARPAATADPDLIRGVLTNLMENAAEAAGAGGVVLGRTFRHEDKAGFEVHDSGPGLSAAARENLFAPTISFKKDGMGLGLSIARRSALVSGGDILLVKGELGGAAFRVTLPAADGATADPDRR